MSHPPLATPKGCVQASRPVNGFHQKGSGGGFLTQGEPGGSGTVPKPSRGIFIGSREFSGDGARIGAPNATKTKNPNRINPLIDSRFDSICLTKLGGFRLAGISSASSGCSTGAVTLAMSDLLHGNLAREFMSIDSLEPNPRKIIR